jgi:hypothetical protein
MGQTPDESTSDRVRYDGEDDRNRGGRGLDRTGYRRGGGNNDVRLEAGQFAGKYGKRFEATLGSSVL